MKFVCLGYLDQARWQALDDAQKDSLVAACFAYDDELRRSNHFLSGEALDESKNAITIKMKGGMVNVSDGPFIETNEVLGGIMYLDAVDLNHAITLISKHPGVAMGGFEIRTLNTELTAEINNRTSAGSP